MKFTRLSLAALHLRNVTSRDAVVARGGPIVSLTTFGKRVETVYLTLESIGAGSTLPSRLILWVNDPGIINNPPLALKKLKHRGLEILITEDYGPHKKYYPYLLSQNDLSVPLVTADDDVVYSRWWLTGLVKALKAFPASVGCYRAHSIQFENGAIAPYLTWKACLTDQPSFRHFATGASGCIYPAEFQKRLKKAGAEFTEVCPTADDVWLHLNALRSGITVRQIGNTPLNFPFLPGTQSDCLAVLNVNGGRNDNQIKRNYKTEDIAALLRVASAADRELEAADV
jgi:hypothetical protein